MLQYLLDNIHLEHVYSIFRQILAVPIGTDGALDLAHLSVFEYNYVTALVCNVCPDVLELKFNQLARPSHILTVHCMYC